MRAETEVNLVVWPTVRESLTSDKFSWIMRELPTSIDMLYNGANGIPIAIDPLGSYLLTWVAAEGITYICDETANDFTLAINFKNPTLQSSIIAIALLMGTILKLLFIQSLKSWWSPIQIRRKGE